MSDYCRHCDYDVRAPTGDSACPFNYLYWDFIARHAKTFEGNARMTMPLRGWARMDRARQEAIQADAARFLSALR
jgi:deoxyribodipyrimidine photolyase-related protein